MRRCRRCGRRRGRRPRRGRAPRRRACGDRTPAAGLRLDPVDRHQRVGAPAVSLGARRAEWVDREVSEQAEPGVGAGHQPVVHDEAPPTLAPIVSTAKCSTERPSPNQCSASIRAARSLASATGHRRRRGELGAEVDVAPSEERRPSDIAEAAHDATEAHADGSDRVVPLRQRVDERGNGSRRPHPGHGSPAGRPTPSGCRRGDPSAHHAAVVGRQLRPTKCCRPASMSSGCGGRPPAPVVTSGSSTTSPASTSGPVIRLRLAVDRSSRWASSRPPRSGPWSRISSDDAPGGRGERTPRLDPRRHGRRA